MMRTKITNLLRPPRCNKMAGSYFLPGPTHSRLLIHKYMIFYLQNRFY